MLIYFSSSHRHPQYNSLNYAQAAEVAVSGSLPNEFKYYCEDDWVCHYSSSLCTSQTLFHPADYTG